MVAHAGAGGLLAEDEAGDHDGEQEQRGRGEQGVVGQGGAHLGDAVRAELADGPGDNADTGHE